MIRDLIALVSGATISFGLGLAATSGDPATFMRWGLVGSAVLLVVLSLVWLVRSPWMSAEVTPKETVNGWTHLVVGFTNHGYGDFGRKIVNILVPDTVEIGEVEGTTVSTTGVIRAPAESVDDVHPSVYWNRLVDLVQGKHARGREIWYGRWYAGTKRIKRSIGPKRQAGSRDGLTRAQAERELRRRMDSERPMPAKTGMTIAEAGEAGPQPRDRRSQGIDPCRA